MFEAGLVSRSKGRTFDKFRNRVMFPIFNTRGKVIGFGGRALADGGPEVSEFSGVQLYFRRKTICTVST